MALFEARYLAYGAQMGTIQQPRVGLCTPEIDLRGYLAVYACRMPVHGRMGRDCRFHEGMATSRAC